jgi:hypothetical protein
MPSHHHSIHLGTAWEPPAAVEADGRVFWTRRFGRPGGLEPGDRVLLVVAAAAVAAEVRVNAVSLPPLTAHADRWTHDITPLLRDRNELRITVAAPAQSDSVREPQGRGPLPSVLGRVTLEIVAAGHAASGSADA